MDEAGVDAGVIHPPAGRDPTSGAFAIEAAKKYPDRFDIMGQFPPENPDNVRLIPGWRKQPGTMGLRWAMLYRDQPKMIVDGKFDWIWAATEKKGLPVSLQASALLNQFRSATLSRIAFEVDRGARQSCTLRRDWRG
jgi:hypothetical protein